MQGAPGAILDSGYDGLSVVVTVKHRMSSSSPTITPFFFFLGLIIDSYFLIILSKLVPKLYNTIAHKVKVIRLSDHTF